MIRKTPPMLSLQTAAVRLRWASQRKVSTFYISNETWALHIYFFTTYINQEIVVFWQCSDCFKRRDNPSDVKKVYCYFFMHFPARWIISKIYCIIFFSSSFIQERDVMPLFLSVKLILDVHSYICSCVSGEKSPTRLPPSTLQPSPEAPQPRNSYVVVFVIGTLTGGVLNTILFYYLKRRNKQ